MAYQTQGRHQDGVRRNGKYWSHQKGQRAHRLGEQCRLQPKIKWPFAHLPRSKGLEPCNQEKSPCHPNIRRIDAQIRREYNLLKGRCATWVLVGSPPRRIWHADNLQQSVWAVQVPPHALLTPNESGCIPAKDGSDSSCPGCIGIADDVAAFGRDAEEHNKNLHTLMQVGRQHGLVFNADKCEIKQERIKFFGLYLDKEGVHPDPKKVADVKDMVAPKDAKGLQQFLGIATYMSPFIPHLSQHTADLRELTKKNSDFEWTASHQKAFQKVKDLICEEVTLSYFNPNKEVTLQVDASGKGLGATLLQDGKPVAFCSKALTDCVERYANIEREMLSVVYGCERFHTYLYGRQFVVESDHKPLESIHLKDQ